MTLARPSPPVSEAPVGAVAQVPAPEGIVGKVPEAAGWTTAFLSLRVAHIVFGMTVARGTFYSPFLDSGQLALTMAMLASVPLVLLFEAIALSRELGAALGAAASKESLSVERE
jgi:hypothetical protein